jgi:type II secretion system protein H
MPCRDKKGFSLMELLVVLVLLGFMAGITGPSMGRFLNTLEFKKETSKILAAFRFARLKAVAEGRIVELSLSEDAKNIELAGAVNESRSFDLADEAYLKLSPEKVIFYPEGQVTPGSIVFTKGEKKRTFILDPLTGLTVEEIPEE